MAAESGETTQVGTGTKVRTQPRKRGRRPHIGRWVARVVLVVLCVVGFATSVLPQGRDVLRGMFLLPALVSASQPAPLLAVGEPIKQTTLTIPASNGPAYLDVYEPAGAPPPVPGSRQAAIIIAGVGDNRGDSQLVNLVEGMARAGVVAVAVGTDALFDWRLDPADADAVVQAFLRMQKWPGVGANRISLIGFSAGDALASLAAIDPRIRDQVVSITSFGGYYDAGTLLRAVGRRALLVDGKPQPWDPDPVPLLTLAHTLSKMLPADEAQVLRDAFQFDGPHPPDSATLARLSDSTRAVVHLLDGDEPTQVDANMAALSPEMLTLLRAVSPSTVVGQIRAPVYLLHDASDRFVPFTESREFDAALTKNGQPHEFVEFSIFEHTEVRKDLPVGELLDDGAHLFIILYGLLAPSV